MPLAVAVRLIGAEGAFMTPGTPPRPVVKEAASLPAASWTALGSLPPVGSV